MSGEHKGDLDTLLVSISKALSMAVTGRKQVLR